MPRHTRSTSIFIASEMFGTWRRMRRCWQQRSAAVKSFPIQTAPAASGETPHSASNHSKRIQIPALASVFPHMRAQKPSIICKHCRRSFTPTRATQRYCSRTRKVAAQRARAKAHTTDFRARLSNLAEIARAEGRLQQYRELLLAEFGRLDSVLIEQPRPTILAEHRVSACLQKRAGCRLKQWIR